MDRDSLAALFEEAIARASAGEHDAVVTWTAADGHWVQISWHVINLAYPHRRSPDAVLAGVTRPEYVELREWAADSHVTFDHGAHDPAALADFVLACGERLWRPAA
ncbi:hypothetical protein ABZ816_34605 [Actinosynnema sp. NPDC047251]|uniref:hypothetical protein n=1 Tax=Saccharothrix espanaensis TaxID=103731 RepID=UPI0002FDA3F6|nr:hypothetical protein [Saccharothrix espanaensis]